MNAKRICLIFSFLVFTSAAHAAVLCGKSAQGEVLIGHAPGTEKVLFNEKELYLSPNGTFLLPLGRDEEKQKSLTLIRGDGSSSLEFEVTPTAWDIQNIKGIPPRKVTPSDSDLQAIEKEQKLVRAAQRETTEAPFWRKGFIQPVKGRISGNFGGQRIMNGIKKNPHAGMDIAAKEGTPVAAAGDGVVTLAYPDLFYSGNVIIIDHGFGLYTIYAHLQNMDVKRGDKVKQGDIIGRVGQTGRATGPHLHWGASVGGTRINPLSLLNINTSDDFCFNL